MASPPKPWKAEYAKSARSSCKTCKSAIGKDQFRLGKMVVATQFDGFMPMWNHASCVLEKKNQIKALGDVEGIDLLRWDDQEKIRKYIDDGSSGASSVPAGASSSTSVSNDDCAIDVSPSSRASCKKCNEKIQKGTIRVSTKREGKGAKGLQWYHVNCFIEMSPSTDIKEVFGWDKLDPEEKENIISLLKKKNTVNEEDEEKDSKGTKRKKGVSDEKPTAKAPKLEETSSREVDASKSGLSDSDLENSESQLKITATTDIKDTRKQLFPEHLSKEPKTSGDCSKAKEKE